MSANALPVQPQQQISLRLVSLLVVFLLGVLGAGCRKDETVKPHSMKPLKKGVRNGALTSTHWVRVVAYGKERKTALGGKTTPYAAGQNVEFSVAEEPDNSGATISLEKDVAGAKSLTTTTSAGGAAGVSFKIGTKPGVYKVKARLVDHPELKPLTVIFLGGVIIEKYKKDGYVNGALEKPIKVRVQESPEKDAAGAIVSFEVMRAPKKTRIMGHEKTTDEHGEVSLEVKLGEKQGPGEIAVRMISGPLGENASRHTIITKFFVIDRWGLVIQILGGLAIFIFGMRLMSEGLSLTAGDKLRRVLNFLTKNRFAAAGAGVVVTGLIQSSSACTVMVIGFVNAGLMQLEQAIGVIMGSNIGTTVTAQMISFKLNKLALPAIAIGVVWLLLAKRNKSKFMAQILIGFGILFLGMTMLSSPLKELKNSELISSMFGHISCAPVNGSIPVLPMLGAVGLGTLVTVIVQSSSASIGLLLAMAYANLIDPYTGFAILLGGNIGTTITAVLASIGSSLTAKRAACAHCLFNVVGTVVMIGLFFIPWPGTNQHPIFLEFVSRITAGDNFGGENLPRFLANSHTLFNVACTLIFIGFVGVFAAACRKLIPGDEPKADEKRKSFLEPHLLATPAIALQQAWAELSYMLDGAHRSHAECFGALFAPSAQALAAARDSVRDQENELDGLQHAITEYLSELSMEQLTSEQGNTIPKLLHSVNDVERIGDHGVHLLRLAKRINKRTLPFTPDAKRELKEMFATVEELFSSCAHTIAKVTSPEITPEIVQESFEEARKLAKTLRKQEHDFRKAHIERHEAGNCDVRSGVVFLDTLANLNRVGGHIMNVMEALVAEESAS